MDIRLEFCEVSWGALLVANASCLEGYFGDVDVGIYFKEYVIVGMVEW